MNVLAVLEGPSWTQCEDIDLKGLEAETGLDVLCRATLTKDQQHPVQSQVGKKLTLGNVEQSLFLVFGQDFTQSNHQSHRGKSFPKGKGRSNVHHADDDE